MLKLKIDNSIIMAEDPDISTEELDLFDISAIDNEEEIPEEEVPTEEQEEDEPIELEETEHGSLIAIEALMEDAEEGVVSLEDMSLLMADGEVFKGEDSSKGKTLFIKDENNINVYLCGSCDDTLDYVIHMLAHASKDVNINIMFSTPAITICDSLELVGGISATKAKVSLHLVCANSIVDLLLLTIENIDIKITNGLQVQHWASCAYGTYYNIETILDFIKSYYSMVYDTLLEKGILTEEEISKLKRNGEMIFIPKQDILSRLSK